MRAGDVMMMKRCDDDVPETAAALARAEEELRATRGFQDRQRALESDTEPDSDAEVLGAGPRGWGDPMFVGSHERRREVCDGAGLCSLGRWPPWRRPSVLHPALRQVRGLLMDFLINLEANVGYNPRVLFQRLAAGEVGDNPFDDNSELLDMLVDKVLVALSTESDSADAQSSDLPQPVRVRALQRILELGGDPDLRGMNHFRRGVRIGLGSKLPRTPAVYARKRRWRLEGQSDKDMDFGGGAGSVR